ncbi:DUF4302 domain-containing protein [Myroides sp. DW712]|uniref:DUF4302 domain-containing protein n=1 Tax=Myroides sp. DW712 TaxID=3389800 RepID=UPI00397A80C7
MRKVFLNGAIAFALVSLLSSCNSDNFESKFDDSPSVRTEKRVKELENELLSSADGWKMIYFTDDSQLGGFTYLYDFEDNKVTMISDVDPYTGYAWSRNPLEKRTSHFLVSPIGSTVNLMFNDANYIHLLSDNSIYPNNDLKGEGYKGDFQFLYYGTDSEGINFLTPREGVKIKMTKATAEDWTNLKLNKDLMTVLRSKRSLIVTDNEGATVYNFRYTAKSRYATVLNDDKTESVNGNGGIGIGFNIDEIIVSPAIEFEDGSTISVLKLENGVFKGEVGENSIIIL